SIQNSMAPPDERDVLRAVRRSRLPRTFPRVLPGEATSELKRPLDTQALAHRSPTRQLISITATISIYTPVRSVLSRGYSPPDSSSYLPGWSLTCPTLKWIAASTLDATPLAPQLD